MVYKNLIHRLSEAMLFALLILLTACQSEEVAPVVTEEIPMLFGSNVSATRALIETTDSLHPLGFGVFGDKNANNLFNNQQVTWDNTIQDANKWTYTPIKYWDKTANVQYDFGAYGPYISNITSGDAMYVSHNSTNHTFSVNNIPQWQKCDNDEEKKAAYDLLVADNRRGAYSTFTNGIVEFSFKHKLAKVIVSVIKDEGSLGNSAVNDVILGGNNNAYNNTQNSEQSLTANQNASIPTQQKRAYTRNYASANDTEEFSAPSASGPVTLISGQNVPVSDTKTILTTYLVAPFALAAGKTIPITVNYTVGDTTVENIPAATSLTGFESNKIYNINIKLKTGAVNVIPEVEIQDWIDGGSSDDEVYNW